MNEPQDSELEQIEDEEIDEIEVREIIREVKTVYPLSTKVLIFALIALMLGLVTFGFMYWDQRDAAQEAQADAAAARLEAQEAGDAVVEAQAQVQALSNKIDCIHLSAITPDSDEASALIELGHGSNLMLGGLKAAFDNDDATSLDEIFAQVDAQIAQTDKALQIFQDSTDARAVEVAAC